MFALLLVVLPVLLGFGCGRVLRRLGWRWPLLAGSVAAAGFSLVALELLPRVGAWDILALAALLGGAVFLGVARIEPGALPLGVAASLFALLGLEMAVRLGLPPAPEFPPARDAAFVMPPGGWDAGCKVLYGPTGVDSEIRSLHTLSDHQHNTVGPLVVHLGDSMTFGEGVREEQAFPRLLELRQPQVIHANYGVWAVGTDFEYVLLQRILAVHAPAMVVLHLYVGNDIADIDRPYECCAGGPLLEYPPGGPLVRCRDARWGFSLRSRLGRSPAPYPLRVATAWSDAARHTVAAFSRLAFHLDRPPHFIQVEAEATSAGWDHFTQILAKLRDETQQHGIQLVVDLLPNRHALESANPTSTAGYRTRQRVQQIAAELGIRDLDPWDQFEAAVKRDGAARYFRGEHDIHFTPEGHRLLADWLAEQLPVP